MIDTDDPQSLAQAEHDDAPVHASSELRWLADAYEQAQRVRIETGERIRAVLQGRDRTFDVDGATPAAPDPDDAADDEPEEPEEESDDVADGILAGIRSGTTLGPVSILGRTYKRMWDQERDTYKAMQHTLKAHPAYPWISRVKGVGPTLACKLLARFDATKAEYASSFWAYAGLATAPGRLYRCAVCRLERSFPADYSVTGKHRKGGAGAACSGALVEVVDATVRVAQPRPGAGSKASYDAYAKKILYLVGTSFVKCGGPYEEWYRKHRARLEVERPGWADGRKHLTALRITEKLFLAHLWQVWRAALGLPTPAPWVVAHAGHDAGSLIDPWSMVKPK